MEIETLINDARWAAKGECEGDCSSCDHSWLPDSGNDKMSACQGKILHTTHSPPLSLHTSHIVCHTGRKELFSSRKNLFLSALFLNFPDAISTELSPTHISTDVLSAKRSSHRKQNIHFTGGELYITLTHAMKHMAHRHSSTHYFTLWALRAHLTLNHPPALLSVPLFISDSELSGGDKLMGLQQRLSRCYKLRWAKALKQ